jgi:hypothetical protein
VRSLDSFPDMRRARLVTIGLSNDSDAQDVRIRLATGRVRWYAVVSLTILAATLAEVLTGSTQLPTIVMYPIGFVFNVGLYGGGALLIREASVRWRKRWGAVILLGGAYAVGEEGFAAKTMINPNSPIIGNQLYSHWIGINWVPLAALTLFHAGFSIAVPILLIELIFPETKGQRLLGRLGLPVTLVLYALDVLLLSLWFGDPYRPSLFPIIFLSGYAASFILAAYRVPRTFLQAKGDRPDRRERTFLLLGLGVMIGFFVAGGGLTPFGGLTVLLFPWPVTVALFVLLAGLTTWYLVGHTGRSENDFVKIAFILGMMLIFIPMDIMLEISGDIGVLAYTALIIGLLLWLRQRIKQADNPLAASHPIA